MGHAKRKEAVHANNRRRVEPDAVLDDSSVDQILELRLGRDDGDPVAGIRNALIGGAVFWVALALASIYIH